MNMGEKIKYLREQKGMTLEQLGDLVGVGKSTVRKWENGMIANMRRDKISLLANALCVSPGYLMGWDDAPPAALLSSEEEHVIGAYRKASEDTKAAVCAVLGVKREPATPSEALPESSDKAAG